MAGHRYEIDWPDGKWTLAAHGIDSIQAIDLAFHMIGSEIYTSNYHKSGQLFLRPQDADTDFRFLKTLRDLLKETTQTSISTEPPAAFANAARADARLAGGGGAPIIDGLNLLAAQGWP